MEWSALPKRPQGAGQQPASVLAEPAHQEIFTGGIQTKLPLTGQNPWTSLFGAESALLYISNAAWVLVRFQSL